MHTHKKMRATSLIQSEILKDFPPRGKLLNWGLQSAQKGKKKTLITHRQHDYACRKSKRSYK